MLIDDPNSAIGKRVIADNPGCMAPDGGECCPQYLALSQENERMREILIWLDRVGGLGLETHGRIRKALGFKSAADD